MALGRVFFGESMFAHETDSSKVALVHLVSLLRHLDVPLIDCQQETAHLASFGARPIPRAAFAGHLSELIHSTEPVAGWRAGAFEASEIELR
jgi:leucyl/phenylalanyl-tRNA---protein transferase